MSEERSVPWAGGLAALGMTVGVVALAFVGVSSLQDPDLPLPPEQQRLQAEKKAALEAQLTPTCGPADFDLVAAVHDPLGTKGQFKPDQDLTIWVAAVNTCAQAVDFTTPSLCLFDGFTLSTAGAEPRRGGTMCAQAITSWSVPSGEAQRASYQIGNLPPGEYTVVAPFAASGALATTTFTVVP